MHLEFPLSVLLIQTVIQKKLDYVIPGNDDAIRAVKLIVAKMADAVIEANQGEEAAEAVEEAEAEETVEA